MKIFHLTNNDFDGVGRAVYSLHRALREKGEDSRMVVLKKTMDDPTVIQLAGGCLSREFKIWNLFISDFIYFVYRKIFWKFKDLCSKPKSLFNNNIACVRLGRIKKLVQGADVLSLYSVQILLDPILLQRIYQFLKVPIVWTPLDIAPLTGGCHFNNGCRNFEEACGYCPQLGKSGESDISRRVWLLKLNCFKNLSLTLVAASSWVKDMISASSLFGGRPAQIIPLGIDPEIFKPGNQSQARKELNLPLKDKIILFGCFDLKDERKGGRYLLEALRIVVEKLKGLKTQKDIRLTLVTIGGNAGNFVPLDMGFSWQHLGLIKDDHSLAKCYQAVDILACPSVDDLGPRMVVEAFMCATAVVAFRQGVAIDLIRHPKDGFLAPLKNVELFAQGLWHFIMEKQGEDPADPLATKEESRQLRETCTVQYQAKQYQKLFKELLSQEESNSQEVRLSDENVLV